MKEKQKPRWIIIKLTGVLFAAYAAYNLFIIVRDRPRGLNAEGVLISALVAFMFGLFAAFSWTTEVLRFRISIMRRYSFILALLTVFLLKLRMSGVMIEFLNPEYDFTVIYGVSYLLTLLGILDLTIYYIIIRKRNPFKRWVTVVFMVIAMVFFVAGLVLEGILLFKYNIGMEPNKLCTLITRPIFYMSFVGLCVYFLFPPPPNEFDRIYLTSDANMIVAPGDEEYIPNLDPECLNPTGTDLVSANDDEEYIPNLDPECLNPTGTDLVSANDDEEYIPNIDPECLNPSGNDLVTPADDEEYIPNIDQECLNPSRNDLVTPADDEEYIPNLDPECLNPTGTDLVAANDDEEYIPNIDPEALNPSGTDLVMADEAQDDQIVDPGFIPQQGTEFVMPAEKDDDLPANIKEFERRGF